MFISKFKSKKVSLTSDKQTSLEKPDINQALKDIKQACDHKDLVAVNHAIVSWGNALFNRSFYSAMDVSSVIDDKALKLMLTAVNKALYAKGEFAEYDALYQHIKSYKLQDDKDQEVLASFYPK